jgi:hypothetical protein
MNQRGLCQSNNNLLPSSTSISESQVCGCCYRLSRLNVKTKGRGGVKMQSTTGNSIYALQDVLGKEKSLAAIEKISKGTRILSEEPTHLVHWRPPAINYKALLYLV